MTEMLEMVSPYLSNVKRSGGDNIVALCPLHEERSPSFSFNVRSGLWQCFGCHAKGNLYTFLRDVAGLPSAELAQYKNAPGDARAHGPPQSEAPQVVEPSPDEPLDDDFLERFYFCPQLLIDEGYPEDLLQQYEVGFDHTHQRITFPLHDIKGNLVGIAGRTVVGDPRRYKFYDREYLQWGLPSRSVAARALLWNLHRVAARAGALAYVAGLNGEGPSRGFIVVTEGYKAVLRLAQAGLGDHAVGLLGSHMSRQQESGLTAIGWPIYLMLDNNEPGRTGQLDAARRLLSLGKDVRVVEYDADQPSDLQPSAITEAVRAAVPASVWLLQPRGRLHLAKPQPPAAHVVEAPAHIDPAAILSAGRVGVAAAICNGALLLAVAVSEGPTVLFEPDDDPLGPIGDALAGVALVGHGLKPAIALLHQHGIRPAHVFDTEIAWRLYDGHRHESSSSFFSLENARTKMGLPAVAEGASLHHRLRADAEHALLLESTLHTLLEEDGLQEVAELEMSLLPIVAEMEATGVAIDATAWQKVTTTWAKEAAKLKQTLITTMGVKNLDHDKDVLAALQRLGLPVKKTSGAALAQYSDRPVVAQLMRYRTLDGFVRSSGKAVLEALERSTDGRVRTTIHQLGARTGRMSCSEPNLMGLPKAKEIRACIVAPPGMKLIIGDYKAIEMRVSTDHTGDEALRLVFSSPEGCPHRHTASLLTGYLEKDITPDQKNMAKPLNFGLCFGMSSKTLVPYARKNFGVVLSEAQAEQFKGEFLDHYKGVRVWQEKMAQEMPVHLRTHSGRVSYYLDDDEGYNARLSFPIQGTAADGMKAAMVLLHPQLARLGARIVLVVHDELVIEAPEEHAEEARVLVRDAMIVGMQKFVTSVPIVVEPEVRSTWAE